MQLYSYTDTQLYKVTYKHTQYRVTRDIGGGKSDTKTEMCLEAGVVHVHRRYYRIIAIVSTNLKS